MISSLNALDIVIIIILFLSVIFGAMKGLVRELLSMAFFIIAVVLSFLFYQDTGKFFSKYVSDKDVSNFAGFLFIFVVVLVVGALVTYYIKKAIVVGPLKPIDRIMGGVFGLLRGILISAVVVFGLIVFPVKKDRLITTSQLAPYIMKTIKVFYELLPVKYKEKIDSIKKEALK